MPMQFGLGALIATQTHDLNGVALAIPVNVRLAALQEVSVDISFESKMLYGSQQFPLAQGRGKGKISCKAKAADVSSAALASLLLGQSAASGTRGVVLDSALIVPATSPYTITIAPPNSGVFVSDMGVINANTGASFARVASGPAAGQYSVNVSTGVYTFAAADQGRPLLISYEYTVAASGKVITINNQVMGTSPRFSAILQNSYNGTTQCLKLNACISDKLSMPFKNEDFAQPDLEFQAFADGSGVLGYFSEF